MSGRPAWLIQGMSIAAKIARAGFLLLAMLAGCRDAPATVPDVLFWAHERDEVVSMPVVVDLDGDGVSEVLINTTRQTRPGSDLAVGLGFRKGPTL